MRSPFMPTYACFPAMWLATLVAAARLAHVTVGWPIVASGWCALALTFGPATIAPHINAVWTTAQTVATFVLVGAVLRQLTRARRVRRSRGPRCESRPCPHDRIDHPRLLRRDGRHRRRRRARDRGGRLRRAAGAGRGHRAARGHRRGWLAAGSQAVDDVAALPAPVLGLGAVGMAVTLVELARLAVFMIDPAQVAWSIQPGNTWRVRHSCVSAYWVACQEMDDVDDVYRLQRYEPPPRRRGPAAAHRRWRRFVLDAYEYPPPFLMVPRLLARVAPTFLALPDSCGSPLQLVAVAAGIVVVARRIGGATGAVALTLSGFILAPYARR